MLKFFIKAFIFVISTSLILNLLGSLADHVAPLEDWRIEEQQRFTKLQQRGDQIEAIHLGNSHSDAIDYAELGMDGESMAFAAADLFEVEKFAAYLVDRLPNLRTVFIGISYYHFSRDNATIEPFRTRRIRYYSMLPAWTPIDSDTRNFVLGRMESYTHVMSVVRSDSWKGVWSGMIDEVPAVNLFPYDGVRTVSAWGTCSHYTAEQLETHALSISKRNVFSSLQMAAGHPGLSQDSFNALARTVEALQSKDIRVILFTPTYYEKYTEHFMERGAPLVEDMRESMERLKQAYAVEYYDFSQDPEIMNHVELFYNSDHLGDCGMRVFSVKLLEAMNANPE